MQLLTTKLISEDVQELVKDGIVAMECNNIVITSKGQRILDTILLTQDDNMKAVLEVARKHNADRKAKADTVTSVEA